jgi:uncharacterized protein (DUF488 family)
VLTRQKTVLALLSRANMTLKPTAFVKLMFLLRHETELQNDSTFYDFVPYKFGPFSFALYRELTNLRRDSYVTHDEEHVALCGYTTDLVGKKLEELPASILRAVNEVVDRFGKLSQSALVKDVYSRYPWYSTKSELTDMRSKSLNCPSKAQTAVYTAGYEGKSVDSFFNCLLEIGIELIIDVRANPVSRRYGFSKRQFSEIAKKLGLGYCHMPSLGIPSKYRVNLKDYDSYQRLLNRYERETLPGLKDEIGEVGKLMQEKPSVLVCVEKDVRCCHRSRLAEAISLETGLEVTHL